jgi:hypothetical protein
MIERRIKAAKFPVTKSLDSFDFKAIPSLNKPLTMELARCEYVDRRENVIALGPSGTGKTHVALGLGLAACQKGMKVRFITAAAVRQCLSDHWRSIGSLHELIAAADERRLQRLQKQLTSQDLLIIAELEERPHRDGLERPRLQPDPGHEHHRHPPADGGDPGVRHLFSRKSRYLRFNSPPWRCRARQNRPRAENPENQSTSVKKTEEA